MKKFCVALAISMIAYGNVEASKINIGINLTHLITSSSNKPPSDQREAPDWTKEVEFTVNGSRYFVGTSRWMKNESAALHMAKTEALGAMAFAKKSSVSTWYEEKTNHTGNSGSIQSSRRNTVDFRHAKTDVTLSGFEVVDVYTEYDKGMFETKYKKYVLVKAADENAVSEGNPGQMNYYNDIGKVWTEPVSGITFVPIPESTLWMSQTEITVQQFRKFQNLKLYKDYDRPDYPASHITYRQVSDFIESFNTYTNYNARLPTQEEWIWACQAGRYQLPAGTSDGNISVSNTRPYGLHSVTKFDPNQFNLFGMSSNVAEFLQNDFGNEYGDHKLMGGSLVTMDKNVDCYYEVKKSSDNWNHIHNGFRLIIE